ncbi:MAG TPA: hypothetical protein VGJ17_07380 [Candidatus Limnocylindrales bacterium]|jgi:hypothetical protein
MTRSLDATRRNQSGRRSTQPKRDPGAYIGRLPERAAETIPGGIGPADERVAAVATQPEPVRGETPAEARGVPAEGHRDATIDRDAERRTAGERH